MLVKDLLKQNAISISFEFFPPKSMEAAQTLFKTIKEILPYNPAYVSVTYGAGGSTRKLTQDLIQKLKLETTLTIVSHLTCVGATKDEIREILTKYDQNGIHNILALRGDPPKGQKTFVPLPNGFNNATELVKFIKTNFPHMGIGVAGFPEGHPECPNRIKEIEYLKAKVDEGADYICTQLFFDNRDFYDYQERCLIAGIKIPIIAGIMPVTNLKSVKRMSELALGARFPAKLLKSLARATNDETAENVGIHWATEQVRDLIDNKVSGIHFYTLNKSRATLKISESLGVKDLSSMNEIKEINF
ncbi:MAG: methylenetetrahydrofolate reductase [NAD(P)H] [Bacteriovoracaceae bacterium]